MPAFTKRREVLRTTTRDGEITINLNLNLSIEGGSFKVEASTSPEIPTQVREAEERPQLEIVPKELFAPGDELISGFGDPPKV